MFYDRKAHVHAVYNSETEQRWEALPWCPGMDWRWHAVTEEDAEGGGPAGHTGQLVS